MGSGLMADAWGGSWSTWWGASWSGTAAQAASTGGGWVDLEEAKRRPKRQAKKAAHEAEILESLRKAYNAANGIVEDAPAELTEAVREAVGGHGRPTERQPLPEVDWQSLARDMAAVKALSAALERLAYERRLEEEAVEMLLMSV